MALGYRAVLTAQATDENRDQILSILRGWATNKKRFPELPPNGSVVNNTGAILTASSYRSEESVGLRWELVEDWDIPEHRPNVVDSTHRAVMHITLVRAEERLWLWIDVDSPMLTVRSTSEETRTEIHTSGTPAFVREVLESVEMRDGRARPLSEFQIVSSSTGVDELVEVLEDDSRVGAVFVTAPPREVPVERWCEESNSRVYAMQGLGIGYVLTREAQAEFNRLAEFGHWVPAGGMRTFLPGARLDDADDSYAHKLLHPSTLRDSGERRVRRILRSAQIQRLANIRLPNVLRDADYEFLRMRRLQPFDVLHKEDVRESHPEPVDSIREVEELRNRLAEAEQMALYAIDENRALALERDDSRLEADLERLEAETYYTRYSIANRQVDKLKKRLDFLQAEVIALGGATSELYAVTEDAVYDYPATFAELVDRVAELSGVEFTGNKDDVAELDEHSSLGEAVVAKAWDALITFDAYSRARDADEFDQSLSHYITHSTHGHLVRIGKVVWSEGETVRASPKYRKQRTFPVDRRVDKQGEMMMVAHVRLSNLTGVAPRIYFADTYSAVNKVTVGYVGAHLDNTLTN
jgi:hypothetical protein